MTLLTICQNAAYDVGFKAPSSIVSNTSTDALQLLRFANKELEILRKSHAWNQIVKEDTITLVTSDQDYALASDFDYILPSTMWNRDDSRMVISSISSEEWQFEKGWGVSVALSLRARIRAGELEFVNTISADLNGETIAYEYASLYAVLASGDSAPTKQSFTVDTDTCALDEELITLGVTWRFKKAKGLPDWEADFLEYKNQRDKSIARDKGARKVNMQSENIHSRYPDRNFTL